MLVCEYHCGQLKHKTTRASSDNLLCHHSQSNANVFVITFCVSRRRRKMYCGHPRLCVLVSVCVSLCLSAAACLHYCMDSDITLGSGRGCPLVVHY